MKKTLTLLLTAITIIAALTACGKDDNENIGGDTLSKDEVTTQDNNDTTEEIKNEIPEYVKGVITESGYESEWLGLSFTPTENMQFATAEEIAASEGENEICEMMVTDLTTFNSATVTVGTVTIESAEAYLEALKTIYATNGLTITNSKISKKEIAGETYDEILCEITLEGFTVKFAAYLKNIGDKAVSILITYDTAEGLDAFLNCFGATK